MRIYMIRHGITQSNKEGRYVGTTDVPLSEEGRRKAKELKPFKNISKVCASPMKRTLETAAILFPGSQIETDRRLVEMDFGHFENKNYDDLKDDPLYIEWVEKGGMEACPGGETPDDFGSRVMTGINDMIHKAKKDGREEIYVVTHGGVIMTVMYIITGGKLDLFDFMVKNCGGWSFQTNGDSFVSVKNITTPLISEYDSFSTTDEIMEGRR